MESMIIWGVMVVGLIYTVINFLRLDKEYSKNKWNKEFVKEYNAIATSYLVQLGCVLLGAMIIF